MLTCGAYLHACLVQSKGVYCQQINPSVTTTEECVATYAQTTEDGYVWGEPGAQFLYANAGFQVIAVIVERLTGMTFEEAFQKHIAGPVGMPSSSYICPIQVTTP